MQLSQSNYLQQRDKIDWSRMPAALTDKPKTVTDNAAAKGWADMGEQTQKATEQFFKLCTLLIGKDGSLLRADDTASSKPTKATPSARAKKTAKSPSTKPKAEPKPPAEKSKLIIDLPARHPQPKEVAHIPTATAFIKRYVTMHGKVKQQAHVLALLHGLQRAISEQRIRKTDPAVNEIIQMQQQLLKLADGMGESCKVEIQEPYLAHYRELAQGEEVRTSIKLLKGFIRMSGKAYDKKKAAALSKRIETAFTKIPTEDPYRTSLTSAAKALDAYGQGKDKSVSIQAVELHGLGAVAAGAGVDGLGIVTTGSGGGAIIRLLKEEGVKDLSERSLKRAFRQTAAPGLCLELARILMQRGDLSMAVLNMAPAKKKTFWEVGVGLAGVDNDSSVTGFRGVDGLDVLEMQLRNSGTSTPLSGLGNVPVSTPSPVRARERSAIPIYKAPSAPSDTVSAKDLAKMTFETIGYNGQFKNVIGDPATGFRMMVFGKPFQGKSSFVIELCKELAGLNRGNVAYLCLEEGISMSMQKKVIDRGADKVEGLDFRGTMLPSFAGYGFVVIDSVSDRGISREQLREMFLHNPDVCFICIFHATKTGDARGGLDFSHDMDIIIRIDAHQPFVEKNRFL